MSRWKVTTPPTFEPVDALDLVAQFRGDGSEDVQYELLESYCKRAREFCENHLDRSIPRQTITLALDDFPRSGVIELPRSPVTSVTSVVYTDSDGDEVTLATSVYALDDFSDPPTVYRRANQEWPTDVADERNAVRIQYVAGYANAASVPETIKHAILLLAAHWEANREAVIAGTISKEIEFAVTALLGQKRVMGV